MRRVFFALWPDEDCAHHLRALAENLSIHAKVPGRLIPTPSLHLTLAFCGSVNADQLAALEERVSAMEFLGTEVILDQVGFWPQGGIVYAGVSRAHGASLRRAMGQLSEATRAIGIPCDRREPNPHVTLLRNARGVALPRLAEPVSWHADSFSLVASHLRPSGARYETLMSWPLIAAGD